MSGSIALPQQADLRPSFVLGNREERRWLIGFLVVVWIVTSVPYLIGFFRQGSDWRFSGFVFGVEDGNSYIGKMLRGADGDWLFRTPYTAYPQNGFFGFLPYLLLGKLTAPPGQHEQLVALFHLFRLIGAGLFIFATYDFLSVFLSSVHLRRLGVFLATFGGGLGWLALLGLGKLFHNGLPLEFYSPETFGWLEVFGLPHLAVARSLLLWGLVIFLQKNRPAYYAGILWFFLGIFQPLTVVIGWVILGIDLLVRIIVIVVDVRREQPTDWTEWRKDLLRAVIIGVVSSPIPIYTFLSFSLDPFLKVWSRQNQILSPPPLDYLLAFGLLLPFAALGVWKVFREKLQPGYLLAGWLFVFPFLAYYPYMLQRRLPEGIWAALIALSFLWLGSISNRRSQRLAQVIVSLSAATTLFVWLGANLSVWNPAEPAFIPASQAQALFSLAKMGQRDAVVLAGYNTSNALPAWAPVFTLIGHGPESMNLAEIQPKVERFYQTESTEVDRHQFIDQFQIRYVFWGPEERSLGNWQPDQSSLLEKIYDQDGYAIFRVTRTALP